ncbi:hypothetical protein AAC387_Pa03g0229 [Persea americana]
MLLLCLHLHNQFIIAAMVLHVASGFAVVILLFRMHFNLSMIMDWFSLPPISMEFQFIQRKTQDSNDQDLITEPTKVAHGTSFRDRYLPVMDLYYS